MYMHMYTDVATGGNGTAALVSDWVGAHRNVSMDMPMCVLSASV